MNWILAYSPKIVAIFLGIYLVPLVAVYFLQRSLQYHPDTEPLDHAVLGMASVERVNLKTPDGETIVAWYKPASTGLPTVLFFHGNGGSIATRPRKISTYANSDFGLLAVSYRGYGDSTGKPSEKGFITDALTAYDWLIEKGLNGKQIFVIGESIGTGVAIQLAAARPVGAVALEAAYASAVDIGANVYWFLPVRWLMHDQFRSIEHIANVKAPLLMIHGTHDTTIPPEQGKLLFAKANEPKQFVTVQDGTHSGVIGDAETWSTELRFFETVFKNQTTH